MERAAAREPPRKVLEAYTSLKLKLENELPLIQCTRLAQLFGMPTAHRDRLEHSGKKLPAAVLFEWLEGQQMEGKPAGTCLMGPSPIELESLRRFMLSADVGAAQLVRHIESFCSLFSATTASASFARAPQVARSSLEFGEKVGSGSYGKVYRGQWQGTPVAIKKFLVEQLTAELKEDFRREGSLLYSLRHPCIVQFLAATDPDVPNQAPCMVMELMEGGNLYAALHVTRRAVNEALIAMDIARALLYLHSANPPIIHRDLKSMNVLLTADMQHAKICDFGLARIKQMTSRTATARAGPVGTVRWAAPEMIQKGKAHTTACDVYSFGIVLYELATRTVPFADDVDYQVITAIMMQQHPEIPASVPEQWRSLIESCRSFDPTQRPLTAALVERLASLPPLSAAAAPAPAAATPSPKSDARIEPVSSPAVSAAEPSPPPTDKAEERMKELLRKLEEDEAARFAANRKARQDKVQSIGRTEADGAIKPRARSATSSSSSEISRIVLDLGSSFVKAGFAGCESPESVFPCIAGRPLAKHAHSALKERYVGHAARLLSSLLDISSPVERGRIRSWDDTERLLHYTFTDELCVAPEEHGILLTQMPLLTPSEREKKVQVLFETFNFLDVYLGEATSMALTAYGRTTGLVVTCGDGYACAVPIIENFPVRPYTFYRGDCAMGGRDVTEYLKRLAERRGWDITASGADHLMMQDVKEQLAYVALDYEAELQTASSSTVCDRAYQLPDGRSMTIGKERFQCAELLFNPATADSPELARQLGIPERVRRAVEHDHLDAWQRKELYDNIVLAGGCTSMTGFADRLQKEVVALAPAAAKVRVRKSADSQYAEWIGGAMWASTSMFDPLAISRQEYEECGPSIVQRKCL